MSTDDSTSPSTAQDRLREVERLLAEEQVGSTPKARQEQERERDELSESDRSVTSRLSIFTLRENERDPEHVRLALQADLEYYTAYYQAARERIERELRDTLKGPALALLWQCEQDHWRTLAQAAQPLTVYLWLADESATSDESLAACLKGILDWIDVQRELVGVWDRFHLVERGTAECRLADDPVTSVLICQRLVRPLLEGRALDPQWQAEVSALRFEARCSPGGYELGTSIIRELFEILRRSAAHFGIPSPPEPEIANPPSFAEFRQTLDVARNWVLKTAPPEDNAPKAAASNQTAGDPERGATADGETQPPIPAASLEQLAEAIGDDNTARIVAIANRRDLSAQRKIEEILRIDSRFAGKDSQEWATLLGVSDAAIRKTAPWKQIRRGQADD